MSRTEGLWTIAARPGATRIETAVPAGEIAAVIGAGTVVVVKDAFDPAEVRRARAAVHRWNAPATEHDMSRGAASTRIRGDDPPVTPIAHCFDSYLFALDNPADAVGPGLRPLFERLGALWRAVTGGSYTFVPGADGRWLRARGLYYPAGGGYFDWHQHPAEPLKVGVILGASEQGVDFDVGGTEFRTPGGVVNTSDAHRIGDVCLFRYDLWHRVTAVDPARERRWDGAGRWVFTLSVQ